MKIRILDQVFTQEEYEVMTFDEVMDILCEHDEIHSETSLKDYVKYLIDKDNLGLALHILNGVYDREYAEWYQYEVSMGTLVSPSALTCKEDIEHLLEEEE